MSANLRIHFLFISLALPLTGFAAPDWSFCSVPVVSRQQTSDVKQSITEIEADRLFSENSNFLQFSGDVQLSRGTLNITADRVELDKEAGIISASGQLSFSDTLYRLNANRMELDDTHNRGSFSQAEFQLYENHLRGSAREVIQIDDNLRELYDVSYTTCDPQQNTWSLDASKLRLDQQDGRGTAYHAVFRLSDVPVFYFPWFQFPIDDRRMSGLLTPTLTRSSISGTQLALPLYWNQADNFDMTISPIWFSNRGLQLNTENRYLFNDHAGQLQLSWLDDDISGKERWYRQWKHEASLGLGIQAALDLQKVSDSKFLDDFDNALGVPVVDFLKSSINFSGKISEWSAAMLIEEYQTVNEAMTIASSPYKRLPRITLNRDFYPTGDSLNLDWKNEWVRFDKEDSITGDRLHIAPVISYPIENSYYFIKPALQLDYTRYALDNNKDDMNAIERSLPLLSLDSGLIFERVASTTRNWLQTLEPRLYFLYVPYQDQTDIPIFDSSLLTENYNSLFVNNRFAGADRLGDSRQVSLGITTRLMNKSNKEIFNASIGQAYYAEDRRVSLNKAVDDRDKSSLMTVVNFKPEPAWNIQLASVYDQMEKQSRQTDISIRRHTSEQVFNLEYHFLQDQLEQSTVSFVYPVTHNWSVFAKQQLSILNDDKPVQNLFGLAYESCCWGFKMLYEEAADIDFAQVDRAVYFQLSFKGLSSAGKDINFLLEDGILGYQPLF